MKTSINDPAKLREKAQELIEQAKQLERARFEKVGRLTMKYYESGFAGFDLEMFRKEIESAL